ncbi:hypothetical protein ElyMa_001901600 [Elysia marginata]|uniref:Uncharacterized protein n=1 Tax=Elysia marginata TaxID=1093978 RepID=A0AAV4ESG3_9GAST|nr:hypothetical protein ElyMa_001901600 [Elysia marginata]
MTLTREATLADQDEGAGRVQVMAGNKPGVSLHQPRPAPAHTQTGPTGARCEAQTRARTQAASEKIYPKYVFTPSSDVVVGTIYLYVFVRFTSSLTVVVDRADRPGQWVKLARLTTSRSGENLVVMTQADCSIMLPLTSVADDRMPVHTQLRTVPGLGSRARVENKREEAAARSSNCATTTGSSS